MLLVLAWDLESFLVVVNWLCGSVMGVQESPCGAVVVYCKHSCRAEVTDLIEIWPVLLEEFRYWEMAFEEQGKSPALS